MRTHDTPGETAERRAVLGGLLALAAAAFLISSVLIVTGRPSLAPGINGALLVVAGVLVAWGTVRLVRRTDTWTTVGMAITALVALALWYLST